jgi:LysM repeat protein
MQLLSIICAMTAKDICCAALFAVASLALGACASAPDVTPTVVATQSIPTARPTTTPQATPTLSPATPPPQREAAVTPTPIVYVVQSGDTLIPIANKFGISVADVIAANGGLDPGSLQIGQRLTIPSGALSPGASNADQTLLPSPTPLPYQIRGENAVRTAAGSLEVVGEVFNNTGTPLTNVQLMVLLKDSNDQPLQRQSAFVARDVIPPNETSPFRILFSAPPAGFATFSLLPLRAEPGTLDAFAKVTVENPNGIPNGSQFNVTGLAKNNDSVPVRALRLVITAYDSERKVVGYRYVDAIQQPLEPGGSAPFEVSIVTASRNIATYAIAPEGLR